MGSYLAEKTGCMDDNSALSYNRGRYGASVVLTEDVTMIQKILVQNTLKLYILVFSYTNDSISSHNNRMVMNTWSRNSCLHPPQNLKRTLIRH